MRSNLRSQETCLYKKQTNFLINSIFVRTNENKYSTEMQLPPVLNKHIEDTTMKRNQFSKYLYARFYTC